MDKPRALSRAEKLSVMTRPPGEMSREQIAAKYSRSTVGHVPDASEVNSSTVMRESGHLVKSAYIPPAKAHELRMLPMEKPTEAKTAYRHAFPDFRKEYEELRALPLSTCQAAFEGLDTGGDGVMLHSELPIALRRVLGHEPTERQRKAFASYFAGAPGGKIPLLDWLDSIGAVADFLEAELQSSFPRHVSESVNIASRFRERQDATRRTGVLPASDDSAAAGAGAGAAPELALSGTAKSAAAAPHSGHGSALLLAATAAATSSGLEPRVPAIGSPSFGLGGTGVHSTASVKPRGPGLASSVASPGRGGFGGAASAGAFSPASATAAAVASRRAVSALGDTASLASAIANSLREGEPAAEAAVAAPPLSSPGGGAGGSGHGHEGGGASSPSRPVGFHLRGPQPRSSYQMDIGGSDADAPVTRPTHDPIGSGLYATSRDLMAGTTRLSHHVPGFCGHVPSVPGTTAGALGLGHKARDVFAAKTDLAATFQTRVPGYGGHKPSQAAEIAPEVQLVKGQFAPTETLRADHIIHTYWAARKAASASASGGAHT